MIAVSTTQQLLAVLKSAAAGTVITLAPGAYKEVSILDVNPQAEIVLTSADRSRPAVLDGLKIAKSSNITFDHLNITTANSTENYFALRITEVKNLKFDTISTYGSYTLAPYKNLMAFYILDSDGIDFVNCNFKQLNAAIVANRDNNVKIVGNNFSKLSKGAIEMGGSSYVSIENNIFTDFDVGPGIHSDAVQIYTAGTKTPAHHIRVAGNLFYRGRGDVAQGIFIQDELGTLPFSEVEVIDNAIIGGQWDSLWVSHATGNLTLINNLAASWSGTDREGRGDRDALTATRFNKTDFRGWLVLRRVDDAKIVEHGNIAQSYQMDRSARIMPPPGNRGMGEVTDQGRALVCDWERRHPGRSNFCDQDR